MELVTNYYSPLLPPLTTTSNLQDRAADVFEKMELELQARENEILELRRQVSLQSSSVESLKQELSAELEKSKQAHSQQVKQLTLRNDQLLAEIEALRRSRCVAAPPSVSLLTN